jgi:integrase
MKKRKLPKHVTAFYDRHGKERFRFRNGPVNRYLRGPYNSPEFKEDLKAAQGADPRCIERSGLGTVNDLVARYYASATFQKAGPERRKVARGIIESFRAEFGDDMVADFTFEHIEAILLAKSAKRREGNRTVGGPVAAQNLHKQLKRLFKHAVRLKMIATNPAAEADGLAAPKTGGRHTWTEEEIARFRKLHPMGTKARLALEILLWTGQRRGDAIDFGPHHIKDGRIEFVASKGKKTMRMPAAPQLLAAIRAMPSVGIKTLLVTEYGKPFSKDGFGNWFAARCMEANVPGRAHGLRKAIARRAAELEATQAMLKAIGGWENDAEVTTYTKGADQARLAEGILNRLAEWDKE